MAFIEAGNKKNKQSRNFKFGDWSIFVSKDTILPSRCITPKECQSFMLNNPYVCDFCKYRKEIDLPQIPEMTFAQNVLKLTHVKGCGIEFNAFDALKLVDSKNDLIKVACAETWQSFRSGPTRNVLRPFDWTYTTHYKGTLFEDRLLKVSQTDERINIEKLKEKEKINFYDSVTLFDDELADNGTAHQYVKIRVMPTSFFILLQYFLRVDNVMVRIIETRYYYEMESNYMLREFVAKESKIQDLKVPPELLMNSELLSEHLPTVKSEFEKIEYNF